MLMKTLSCFVPQEYAANMEEHGLQQIVSDVNDILRHIEVEVVIQWELTHMPDFVCANYFEDDNLLRMQYTIQLDACLFPLQQETRINILDGELYFFSTKIAPIPANKRLTSIYRQHKELQAAFEADMYNIDVWKQLEQVHKEKEQTESRAVNTLTEIARIPMEMMEPIVNGEDTTSVYTHLFHIAMQEEETADVNALYEEAIQQLKNDTVKNRIRLLLSYGNYLYDYGKEEMLIPYSKILQLYGDDQPTDINEISITARIMARIGLHMRTEEDMESALTYLKGALTLRSELAKVDPSKYLSYEASCHWNLYLLYSDMDNEKLLRHHLLKFYEISVALVEKYLPAYVVDFADAVGSMGYAFDNDSKEYQTAINKACDISTEKLQYENAYNLRLLALIHWKIGQNDENAGMEVIAQQFYLIALKWAEQAFKQNPLFAGDVLLVLLYHLGDIHDSLRKYKDAQNFYERYINIACCYLQCGSDEYLEPLETVLDEYDKLIENRTKDHEAQFHVHKTVVDTLQTCEKRDSDTYLSSLAARAFRLVTCNGYGDHKDEVRGKYAPIAYDTIKECEAQDGVDRSSNVSTMADLIGVHHYYTTHDFEKAEQYFKEAAERYRRIEDTEEDTEMLAYFAGETQRRLGEIYLNAHRYAEAEKAFAEAVRYAKMPEKELQQIIPSLSGLADALREQSKDNAAKDAYLQMLRASEKHEKDNHIDELEDDIRILRGSAYSWLASYYLKIGQNEIAEDCYHKAVALLEEEEATKLKGESDDEYWARVKPETLDELAHDFCVKAFELAKEKKHEEAIGLFLRAVELWLSAKEKLNHAPIYNLGVAYIQLAHLYMLDKNDIDSITCYRNAIIEWEQEIEEIPNTPKQTHSSLIEAYRSLAAVYYRQKRFDEVEGASRNCVKAFIRAQYHDCDLPIKPIREILSYVTELHDTINVEDNIYTFAIGLLDELQQKEAAYKRDYALVCNDYGEALKMRKQYEHAEIAYKEALRIFLQVNEQANGAFDGYVAEVQQALKSLK